MQKENFEDFLSRNATFWSVSGAFLIVLIGLPAVGKVNLFLFV